MFEDPIVVLTHNSCIALIKTNMNSTVENISFYTPKIPGFISEWYICIGYEAEGCPDI